MSSSTRRTESIVSLDFVSLQYSLRELEKRTGLTAASGSYSKGDSRHGREARESVLKVVPGVTAQGGLEDQIRDLIERTTAPPTFAEDVLTSGTTIVLSIAAFPDLYSSHILLPRDLIRQISERGWAVELSWYRTDGVDL